eukprot:g31507.t1
MENVLGNSLNAKLLFNFKPGSSTVIGQVIAMGNASENWCPVYHTPTRDVPEYYRLLSPYYQDDYPQFLQPGTRPDSICSVPAYDRMTARWSIDERQSAFLPREWQDRRAYSGQGSPVWHGAQPGYSHEVDSITGTMRRMSLQPRSRSVPRSPSQAPLVVNRVYSPVRSPSARFDRLPRRRDEMFGPPAYTLRRSRSAK